MCRAAYISCFIVFVFFSAFLLPMAPTPLHAQTPTESVLYAPSSISDGINIFAPVIQASDGNFYGIATTSSLNNSTGSAIFQVTPSGKSALVYTFPIANDYTRIGLTEGSDGNLYGVSTIGGTDGNYHDGLIFKVSTSGAYTLLYTFCASQDSHGNCVGGIQPNGVLVQGLDGEFYGTTQTLGANGGGTIFRITSSGNLTTLYNFCSQGGSACTDGMGPEAGLIQGSDGNFYGTTAQGGIACPAATGTVPGCGTVFKITPSGVYSVIYNFTGGNDGAFPGSRLVQGADGDFYGTTQWGYNDPTVLGTAYKITPSGTLTTLYNLSGDQGNEDGLVLGSDGNFYGTDYAGGHNGYGSVYQIAPSGAATVVYSFANSPDGAAPEAPPTQGADGNFYGTTLNGGALLDSGLYDSGAVYKLAVVPSLQPPVALTLNSQSIEVGESATLNWSVANAYSDTLQQCYAFVQGTSNGSGTWTGLQTGIFDSTKNPPYSGSATITPTLDGTYTYALTCGGMESGFATLTVGTPAQLTVTTSSLPAGTVGVAYSQTVQASGGAAPYSWSITSGSLPAGLTLAAGTGVISGTPTSSTVSAFTVNAKDSESTPETATASLGITVNPVPVVIATSSLPNGMVGTAYSQTLEASGGIAPYTWSIASGSLPAGLSLAASTGVISGTPAASAVSNFTIEVKDSESMVLTSTAKLSITVNAPIAPGFSISASTSSLSMAAGQSGTTTITLTPTGGFGGTVNLNCTGLPQYSTCSFSPASLSPSGSNTSVTTLTIATNATTTASLRNTQPELPSRNSFPMYAAGSLAGLVLLFGFRSRLSAARHFFCGLFLFAGLAAGGIGLISGCGGGGTTKSSPTPTGSVTPAGAYTVTVTASASTGSAQNTLSLALAVTQ